MSPLLILLMPVAYMLLATMSLIWFSFIYDGLINGMKMLYAVPAVEPYKDVVQVFMLKLEKIYGPSHKFSPTTTHVILVAIFLVLAIQLDRIRVALARKERRD